MRTVVVFLVPKSPPVSFHLSPFHVTSLFPNLHLRSSFNKVTEKQYNKSVLLVPWELLCHNCTLITKVVSEGRGGVYILQ